MINDNNDGGICATGAGIADHRILKAGHDICRHHGSAILKLEDHMRPLLLNPNHPQQDMTNGSDQHDIATRHEGVLRRWMRAVVQNWQRRKMIAALEALDDRLLLDIGIIRGDIARVVSEFDDREMRMTPVASSPMAHRVEHEPRQKAA